MPFLQHTSPCKKARIVFLRKEGETVRNVATQLGVAPSTVSRIFKTYGNTKNFYDTKPKTGRKPKFTEEEARKAAQMLAKNEACDAADLQRKAFPHVSVETVRQGLRKQGLNGCVRRKKPYISATNKYK